jgi:hypothetical protein
MARRRPALPLPKIGDRPRNFWARVNVGVHGELVLHFQSPVHVADDDGVLVLYMMSKMIPHQQQCLTAMSNRNFYQAMSIKLTAMCTKLTPMPNLHQCLPSLQQWLICINVYQANTNA